MACEAFNIANQRCGGHLRLKVLSDIPHEMVPLHVAACDIILCTSHYEGWPNSVKEAIACGVPFVATDVSDLQEISLNAPPCKVCRATPIDLANGLVDILNNTFNRALDGLIIRNAVQSMGTENSAKALANIYKSLL